MKESVLLPFNDLFIDTQMKSEDVNRTIFSHRLTIV